MIHPIIQAVAYMHANGYSQVVVQSGEGLQVLTVEGLAGWFGERAGADCINLEEARLSQAVACEPPGSFTVMSRHQTIFDARAAFAQHPSPGQARLAVIIVTENGERAETPLGLITPWDLVVSVGDGPAPA